MSDRESESAGAEKVMANADRKGVTQREVTRHDQEEYIHDQEAEYKM
jgi:hypothetical protein